MAEQEPAGVQVIDVPDARKAGWEVAVAVTGYPGVPEGSLIFRVMTGRGPAALVLPPGAKIVNKRGRPFIDGCVFVGEPAAPAGLHARERAP